MRLASCGGVVRFRRPVLTSQHKMGSTVSPATFFPPSAVGAPIGRIVVRPHLGSGGLGRGPRGLLIQACWNLLYSRLIPGDSMQHDRNVSDTDTRAIKFLQQELARLQLAVRAVKSEVLYVLIEKYVAAARQGQPDKPVKAIVADAAAHYGVSIRTVWNAVGSSTK